jgi:hypothetical protein
MPGNTNAWNSLLPRNEFAEEMDETVNARTIQCQKISAADQFTRRARKQVRTPANKTAEDPNETCSKRNRPWLRASEPLNSPQNAHVMRFGFAANACVPGLPKNLARRVVAGSAAWLSKFNVNYK